MGKNQKIKEQRKIEGLQKELKKEARWRLFRMIASGVSVGIILGSVTFLGIKTMNLKLFPTKKATTTNAKSYKTGDHKYSQAPDMQIDAKKSYIAKFETPKGNFEVTLAAKDAPKTVNNFVTLAKDKFYDGLTFHRIVKDFMVQGGDPDGSGSGGPGYKFDDETVVGDYTQGTIAMANSGKNTNGSQFFIMTGDYSGGKLPKDYVIFGKVSSGLDVVMKLNETATTDGGSGEKSKPTEKVLISKVTVEEK
jgi:cyclophilin family peptidyl-prolyl cis-trans isomerase